MKFSIFALLIAILSSCNFLPANTDSTSNSLQHYSKLITPEFLEMHLQVIAHDTLEGRATGTRGQKVAAQYLSDFYDDLGFDPVGDNQTYFQHFNLSADYTDSLVYQVNRVLTNDTLMVSYSVESKDSSGDFIRMFGGAEPLSADIIFAGFGLNDPSYSVQHLEGESLQDNWVLMFEDIPYIIDGDTLINPSISSNSRLSTILGTYDAAGILLISEYSSEEFTELAEISSTLMSNPSNMALEYLSNEQRSAGFPKGVMQISPDKAQYLLSPEGDQSLFDIRENLIRNMTGFRAHSTTFSLDYTPFDGPGYIESENVVSFFEGSDPNLKDEVLVLVAHYDHLGITQPDETGDMINNGADDNGSGTVALMSIANAFHAASLEGHRPKRSVLFLHVSAEEIGLLGSRYYSDHPIVPIEQTVAAFNADMIGRSDPVNIEKGDTDYVYLIGGEIISSELDSLVQVANKQSVNMRLDRKYNDLEDRNQFYRRSDHWNFGRLEVPFVFFFTGVHDDYHSPSDTVHKIDFTKLSQVAQLIFNSSLEVLNYDGRPQVDNEQFIEITRRLPR